MSWNHDHPTIIEHTVIEPTVERQTIIERDSWNSEPWAIAMVIAVIAIVGLVAFWAINTTNPEPSTTVSKTIIERPAAEQRAQRIAPSTTVNVNPPAVAPSSTATGSNPPANSSTGTPPDTSSGGAGEGTAGTSGAGTSTTGQ